MTNFVPTLDNLLTANGITNRAYGLTGFGGGGIGNGGRTIQVGGMQFGTASQFQTATGNLMTTGAFEDGYDAIQFVLDTYNFAPAGTGSRIIILVTDEDRDVADGSDTFASVQANLNAAGAVLSGIIGQQATDQGGTAAVGTNSISAFTDTNNDGVPETSTAPIFTTDAGTTFEDYTQLILSNPNGFVGDVTRIGAGGTDLQAFAAALANSFLEIIVVAPNADPVIITASTDTARNMARVLSTTLNDRGASVLLLRKNSVSGLGGAEDATAQFGAIGSLAVNLPTQQVEPSAFGPALLQGGAFHNGDGGFFLSVSGGFADFNHDAPFTNFDRNSYSIIGGVDKIVQPNMVLGAAFGYQTADNDINGGGNVDADSWSGAIYGSVLTSSGLVLSGNVSYGEIDFDTSRVAGGVTFSGSTSADILGVSARATTTKQYDEFLISTSVEGGFADYTIDAFTETTMGGVTFGEINDSHVWLAPRVDIAKSIETDNGIISPRVGIGAQFQSGRDDAIGTTTGAATIASALPSVDNAVFNVRAGADFTTTSSSMIASINYEGDFGSTITSHSFEGRLSFNF
ncbi:MAG: autotransporter outer membrane beta-barrel domain-containing protein [Pseudomonadota bacterium]